MFLLHLLSFHLKKLMNFDKEIFSERRTSKENCPAIVLGNGTDRARVKSEFGMNALK